MEILYSPKFSRQYKKLTREIKEKFEEKEIIFRSNPFDSSLKTHKLNGELKDYWSFSINYEIRVIFIFHDADTIRLELIGDHDIY
jgi:mRNA-degrading endonuclease YafQ of YafQ-DinJ toxin-antitoxin module